MKNNEIAFEHLGILIHHQCDYFLHQTENHLIWGLGKSVSSYFKTNTNEIRDIKEKLFNSTNALSISKLSKSQKETCKRIVEMKFINDLEHPRNGDRQQEYYALEKACERMIVKFELSFIFN